MYNFEGVCTFRLLTVAKDLASNG